MSAFVMAMPLCGMAPGTFGRSLGICTSSGRVRSTFNRRSPVPLMTATSKSTDSDVRIRLYGNNIQITDSLRDYVDRKIGKVIRKYTRLCTKVDVHLAVQRSVAAGQSAEVVVFSGKNILRREVKSSDMYAAIDEVEEKLGRTLRKFKERREGKEHKTLDQASQSVFVDVREDDFDEMEDTFSSSAAQTPESMMSEVNGLVKRKVFPLPKQTVEEAILCLEYLDHDFYMFCSSESGRVSVVYRRKNGGYGLLEPES